MSILNSRATVLLAGLGAVLLSAGLVAGKATFTPISGRAWLIALPAGGEVKCFTGTQTGTWPPCTLGTKSQIRGMNLRYRQEFQKADGSVDPLHTGIRTLIFNANLDENGRGNAWGTWRVVLDGGRGEWEGTFTGSGFGWFGAADGDVVGHGTEGEVDGMQVRLFFSYEAFPVNPATGQPGLETDTGYRLDPNGGK